MNRKQLDTSVRERREIPMDEVEPRKYDGVRIKYVTNRHSTKTVEGTRPDTPPGYREHPAPQDDGLAFWSNGDHYLLDTENGVLYKHGDDWRKISDEIRGIWELSYPDPASVVGDIEEGKMVTVHYVTRYGNENSFKMKAEHIDGVRSDISISGTRENGKRVQVGSALDRRVEGRQFMGYTSRIEFPRGEEFSVKVENSHNLTPKKIEEAIEEATPYGDDDVEISVEREGELTWDDR